MTARRFTRSDAEQVPSPAPSPVYTTNTYSVGSEWGLTNRSLFQLNLSRFSVLSPTPLESSLIKGTAVEQQRERLQGPRIGYNLSPSVDKAKRRQARPSLPSLPVLPSAALEGAGAGTQAVEPEEWKATAVEPEEWKATVRKPSMYGRERSVPPALWSVRSAAATEQDNSEVGTARYCPPRRGHSLDCQVLPVTSSTLIFNPRVFKSTDIL